MNLILAALFLALQVWQFFVVPMLPEVWLWMLVPLALTNNTLWALIHETIHGNFSPRHAVNLWTGRVLSAFFGSSFAFLSAGHLSHHALNRTEAEQLEIMKPGETAVHAVAVYYFFLCGGLYLLELLVPFAFIIPVYELRKHFRQGTMSRALLERCANKPWTVVFESVCAILILATSAYLYRDHIWWFVFILGARALFISSLDYIYHYDTPTGDVKSALDLHAPRWVSALLLNFNYHHTHHKDPKLRWRELPCPTWSEREDTFFRAALRAWRGPRAPL